MLANSVCTFSACLSLLSMRLVLRGDVLMLLKVLDALVTIFVDGEGLVATIIG